MSPTRRDIFFKLMGGAGLAAVIPTAAPAAAIDPVHLEWKASIMVEKNSGEYLVNGGAMTISSDGVTFVVTDASPFSEQRTIESTDPAVAAFLSEVVAAMREMQYGKRPADRKLTDDQWRHLAAQQLAGKSLSEMTLQ